MRRKHVKTKPTDLVEAAIEAELVRRDTENLPKDFYAFVLAAWDEVEQYSFKDGMHIQAICAHLQAAAERRIKTLCINLPPRLGKALADDTPILTTSGWKKHGALVPGDMVFHPSGQPVAVVAVGEPVQCDKRVLFQDGAKIVCHAQHEWPIYDRGELTERVVTTQYLQSRTLVSGRAKTRSVIQSLPRKSLEQPEVPLPLDPYFLGVWLGDGRSQHPDFCFAEQDRCVLNEIIQRGLEPSWTFVHKDTKVNYVGFRSLKPLFYQVGLMGGKPKHIPNIYLQASKKQRLDLLAGLIDTDGTVNKNGRVIISTCQPELRDSLIELVRGLGMRVGYSTTPASLSSSGIQGRKDVYNVHFQPREVIPTVIPRKAIRRLVPVARRIGFVSVTDVTPVSGRCIQVASPDGQYLAGRELVPTHNSVLCSVLFPAWILARSPKETLLFASYSQTLANRDSVKTRALVESDWYQARFPHVKIRDDSNLKTAFITTEGGGRQCTSVGGTVTGLGGSFLVLDDPLNASDGESAVVRETANQWFQESWSNRVAGDPNQAVRIVIMQRLHARDVSALCKDAGWDMLILPMEYEGKSDPTALAWTDPRTEFGQLLWPEQWGREAVDRMKVTLGSYAYAGQYQQRPAPRGGGILKRHWIRYWYDPTVLANPDPVQVQLPDGEWVEAVQEPLTIQPDMRTEASWDCSFKGGVKNDYVVGQVWHKDKAKFYLLDQFRAKADFPETVAAVRQIANTWRPLPIMIEGKANGPAVISALQGEISGILEINPAGGKESRASSIAPLFEAGNVYLPHPQMAAWVEESIQEITMFPRAPHDDVVDAMSQALVHMRDRRVEVVDMDATYSDGRGSTTQIDLVGESYWAN